MNLQIDKEKWSPLKRFFRLLRLDRKDITYVYIYAVFSGLITLSLPLGVQAIIGLIAGGAFSTSLVVLVLIVTVGTALAGILKVMQLTVTETLQRRIFTRSAFEFAYRIPRLQFEGTMSKYPPELVNRFFDTITLQKGIPKILIDFSSAVLQIIFGLILISFYHPFFIFFGILLVSLLVGIIWVTGPRGLKTSLKESDNKYEVAHWLEELGRAMTTFKLSGQGKIAVRITDNLVKDYLDNRKKHFRVLLTQYGNIVGFKTIITGTLLLLGSILVIDNRINIGQFVASEIVVILMIASAEKLILTMETVYDVLTAVEKIGKVTDLPLDGESGLDFSNIDQANGLSLELANIGFRFADAESPALENLSLSIDAGQRVCVASYKGSGKSTLIRIIAGFYTGYSGSLSYNGFSIKSLNLSSLRQYIGYHSQQEDIFKGTILENILLDKEGIDLNEVVAVAKSVNLHQHIQRLPQGYSSQLSPGGRNLSHSLRTKIMLVRSIVARPRLMAMEDFLHKLDQSDRKTLTEYLLQSNHPWTLVAVSNDPDFAAQCDKVIILKDGKVVEQGTYSEIKQSAHFEQVFNISYQS